MIRVTIELLPHGHERNKRTLGTMEIANDGSGDVATGSYRGTLHAEYTPLSGRKGQVLQFHRRKQSVWSLVGAFLKLWGHTKHSPMLMTSKATPTSSAASAATSASEFTTTDAGRKDER